MTGNILSRNIFTVNQLRRVKILRLGTDNSNIRIVGVEVRLEEPWLVGELVSSGATCRFISVFPVVPCGADVRVRLDSDIVSQTTMSTVLNT